MRSDGAIPLVVDTPYGRADLIIDGALPLRSLLPALLAATGVSPGVPGGGSCEKWQVWEGSRRLDDSLTLGDLGVLPGSELRIVSGT